METGPKKKKLSANGKRVYHDLQEAGGDCGTEEQFYDFLNAPREQGYKNRRKVYEDLKKSGGDPGTYEQFAQWLGVHPIKPSAPVAAAQKPAAAQTAHPQQTAQAAAPVQRAPAAKPKPRNGQLTAAQRQAYIARAQQMSQQVGASVQRTRNRMGYAMATSGLKTPRVQLGSKASGGAKLGENSRVVATQPKFNPATGKMERVYLTELGNEYTSRAEADMEQNEIDEAVQQQLYPGYNDYNDKQAVAAQAPATAVAAQLWKEAQKAYDAERNANAKEVYGGNPWLRGGREMHVVDGATNSGKNDESRLKHFDLQKMSDNAWARVGKQMTASCYARLRKMYPNALERQVQASAEKEARALVQNAVYKYAVKMNAPKSQLDFFLRKAVDANLLTSVFRGLARYGAGTTGDMAAYEAANEEYGKSHRWTGVFGTATGMAFDPTNWVGVYIGSLGGKAALNIGGRFVLGSAPGVGARLFGSTMAGRLATGAASGMGMMGTYEGVKEAERQWVYGGHVNPETRENEGYSAGAVALSALKGAGLGAMTGMVSPLVGNVADKVVQTTTSATGKVATRLGEVATSAVAEGTIFAMPAVISGQESFVDAWTESMAMIVGFKGQHMVKSAGQVIAGMRPVANPRTMEERNRNRRGFAENLKRTMDAGANKQWNGNQPDVRFTKEELAELKQMGYGNLASLLTPTEKVLPKKKPSQPKHPKNTDGLTVYFDVGSGKKEADPKMKWLQQHPEFDGYATMEKLMQDPNVSQAARAKAYYMLTGRQLPMGTITGWNVGKDDKGNIWVKSVTSEGEVVTSRRFTDEASAKREEAKIIRQVELNTVDMGEQYKEMQANAAVVETAIKAVAPNADVNEAMRVYGEVKKGNKDYDSYKDLAKSIDEAIASNPEAVERAKTLLPENIRKDIAEQTGVEVDKALGKPEAERTDAEKQAVQTYLERLYDKSASDDAATPPDAQLQGPEQFAEAYAKHRTHKGSGQVVPATMKAGDRKVYVIDGDVVQYTDKSGIDVAKSDKSIVVCDAETGKYEYTSPDQLMNVGEPADPSTLSEAYMANERAKEAAANGEGTAEGNAAAESNAAANGDVSSDGGKAEVEEPAYTDGSRVEINGHEYDVKSAGEKTVVLVDEHGKELAWTRSALDAKLESGDAEVLEPKAEAAPDVATEGLKAGDVFADSDGNALTVKRVDGDKVVAVGADGKEQTYEDGMFEQMVESGVLKRAQKTEEPSEAKVDLTDNQGNSTPQPDLSSESKGAEQSSGVQAEVPQAEVQENAPMPMRVVGKGKNAAQEEDWLATTPKRGHDYVFKESGLDAEEANAFVENKVAEAEKNLEKVKGKAPKMGTNIAAYKEAKADYEARVAEAQKAVDYWHAVKAERDKVLLEERRARKEKDKALYDDAVAQEEQRKAEMAQKAAEQEALGSNALAPAIKEKWENAPKVDGGADEITLPNGEVVTGHYVLTESGAASASHQATNGFAETEGYPVDVNGETVNDRDYKRDAEAQQVTRGMAADYDSRALQSPVVVSGDGVVLSGNGRTMAGEIAALNGSDAKYNAYLRGHAGKFGFTTEQVEGFEHPRVVFVPDGEMPYTSETFAKFNQREQKSQSRTEMAVKLGKVVDDALFGRVMDVIGRHESLAEFYADDAATASVVKELADAGVIPQTEMAQLFDGGRLSESGQAMVEGVLVGKVFQGSPDAVRQITEVKSMRKAVMAALPEVVACHRLGGGYDLSKELAAAVDLVYKARKAGFKLGQHVSQHARQGNLFQLDDGATVADYNNAAVMMLADVMNDGRVTQLKKVLSFYNTQAADSAQGIGDMFAGGVKSKGQIINEVNELLNNGQEYDRRTPSVADGQGVGGEGGEQGDVAGPSHQGGAGSERGLSEAFDGLAAQLKTAEGEERKRVLGEMRDGIARFAEENGYPVPEFLLTREDFLAAVPEKDRAKYVEWLDDGAHMPAYYTKGKVYVYVEGCETFDKDVNETLAHEYTHADNAEFPENVNALTYALEDTHEVTRDELREILREMSQGEHYDREAERLEAEDKDVNKMLADEVIAHAVARMVVEGEQVLDGITKNPTLQFIIKRAYKARENERQYNIRARENAERHDNASEGDNRGGSNNGANVEGESANGGVGRPVNGSEGGEVSSERGRSAVSGGKEVAAPSLEGAKVGVTDGEKSSATGDVVPSGKGKTDNLRQQKAVGTSAQPPTREESILRDVVIEHMKGSGLDVIGTEDGQRVLDMVNEDGAKEHRVYHGSGAEFDHFDHSHMGEGEGAQAYGWGTYVTEVRGIGEGYAIRSKNGISMSREEWSLKRSELESNIYRAKEQLPFLKGEYKAEVEAQISEWEEQLKDYEPHNYLYTVEIPDDNGGNYLDWNGPVPAETIDRITEYLREKYGDEVVNGIWLSNPLLSSKGVDVSARNGAAIYRQLERALGSDKKASLALAELGYAGIKYPAEFRSGGRKDGAKNYVIFNENDAEITDHVRFFKTKNGEAYGFTVGGKIYYDPRIANAETPVHEYAHLWASALKANNAKEWKNVVELMKGTNVWEEVKKAYPELETDDEIADEVLATYSGRRGAERLREEMRKAAAEGNGVMGKAEAVSALQRVKRAIDKFWKAVADFLHIHYTSADEVADRVMKDLLDGVDPRSMMDGGKSLRPETRVNVVEAEAGHGFKNYAEAKTWAKEHIARTYSGEETGGKGDIRISNAAVDKYLSQSAVDKSESKDVHLAVLKVLLDVIRESVDAEQHADFKKGKDGVRSAANGVNPNVTIHRLYGAVRMDGKLYRVKVTLKEDKTSKEPKVPHSYEATKIELFAGTLGNSDNSLSPNTNNSITAANLLNGVDKSYDGGKFFEDYNKIREQFIGEKGAAAADHADEVNTRLDNLSVAREMESEKKDAKAIKMATGWERGADGKWRYEMPDAKIKETMDIDGHVVKRFDEDMLWNDGKLADVVDAPELFKAYPQLKETRIVTDAVTGDMPSTGDYDAKTNTITIHSEELKYMNGILNHEVQHAIQKIEGFARGGSPAMVRSEIKKQMAEVTKQIRKLRAEGKEAEAKELIKKNRGLYEASVGDDDFGSYKSLAGEVESRNVESRMGMSAAERRASLAAETEDVSREDQIFLTSGDGGETAHSVEMVHKPSKEESILRDVVIEHMKGSGLDVIGTEDGQRVLDMANDDGAKEHRVYHGSGADFDHFDHSHMGEGEGAQAYGWGTYVTEVEGIGRTYAESARKKPTYLYGGKEMPSDEFHDYVLGKIGDRNENMLNDFMYNLERHGVTRAKDILKKGDLAQYKNLFYQSIGDTRNYAEGKIKAARTLLSLKGIRIRKPKSHLYAIEIPEDNGKNYLDWNSETGKDLVSRLVSILRADKELKEAYEGRLSELNKELDKFAPRTLFSDTYVQLAELLGSDKKASQLLSSLGYVGIKYPADNMRGGREDDAKNYVIFNENDAEITDHVRFFKTKNGEAYGFTVGGKIYYDPRIANAETPVHEYAHLWASALKANNTKEWKNVVDLMKGTNVWEEVKKTYPELETDDEIADEVLATYSGRRGAERLREEMRKAAAEGDGVMGKAEAVSALQRVKLAIDKFWKAVADFLHIHYTSAEEVADRVMKDLLDGVDPRKFVKKDNVKEIDGIRYSLKDGSFLRSGSYFSGGGLLEEGLKDYLDPKVAVEFNEKISGVYRDNFGNHIVTADVRDVDPKELVKDIDGPVQYFHASPVCKNFSTAKRDGGEVELDKETARSTAQFIGETRPKVVTIENVKGYKNSDALKIITDELTAQGYDWDMGVYNAADYGGYTNRERLIVRAVRDGKLPPKPEALPEGERKGGWIEAVSDLMEGLPEKKSGVPKWVDERLKGEGIDYRHIDKPLYVFGQGNSRTSIPHAFADELLPTLRTKGGDMIIMPDGRVLKVTPRVLARVTGLADDYEMPATDDLAHTVVGNGIPTQLSEHIIGPLLADVFNGGEPARKDGSAHLGRGNVAGEMGAAEDYTAFASRYGVSEDMVKDYAFGMETGNLQKANFALAEIRRTMRVANRGMKLSEFGKLFRPVQKELAERYGDIEVLRQEYIDAEMRERGVMEAARKRAEEEAAKRKARADELRLLPEEELDRRYFEAVERGDDAAAREMLDEAARRKGYGDTESEYQGVGAWVAPSNPGYETDEARRDAVGEDSPNLNVEDMAAGYSNQPEDIFVHPDKYSQGLSTSKESGKAIQTAIDDIRNGKKEVKIKVYRAVPTSVKESKLRNGDWVTPSKEYAEMHGNNRLEGKYRIIEDEVPAGELWWDGNDVNEWGFDDGKGYKYKNVENSRKLNDLVTRDDNGEIIAPSKRFDENVEDVRFREDNVKNPAEMSEEEKSSRGNLLLSVPAVNVESNQIVKTEEMSARRAAEKWWREHIGEPLFYDTEVGQVEINENSIGSSLAHRYGQAKLDAITSLKDGFKNAVYLGTMPDFVRQEGVQNHYFAYPIMYNGKRNYVFCRAMQDNNKNRLYVHEVFVADSIQNEGNTLQTAASQPHGGIALYKAILSDVLSAAKVGNNFETLQLSASEKAKHQAANDLARQMHVEGEVEVVTSTEGLTGRQAKAKGWYDVRTGRVTIVLPNNKNAADVRETVFHEVVAHKGLRNLVGEEHFNTFLDNVYNNAEEGIKQTIDEMAEKKYNGDKRKATEEYMAHLAEDGEYVKPENQGFFAKVRDFLTDLLRKVGIKLGFKLTDNDLRYILWRSWKGLAERDGGSVFEKAEDVKMQHELGQTDEARSASGENGIMFREGSDELKDVVEKMKADVERLHEGELDDLRSGARAIGGRLSELNKAMRLQRAYDMSTVASVTELAKTMLKNGLLSEMSDYDVRRLLSVVNNVHGKGDIRPYVQKVVDMMVGNRLRNVSKAFDKLLAMRGKKVDARGVEVQGELDLAGQRMADVVWKGIGMSDDDVADMCADAQDRMMSANGAEAAAAATDYAGWQIVMRYNETIRDSKSEEVRLREDLKRAKEDYDAGRMTREAYMEFRESTNDAIRENRIERAEAYEELYEQLGGAYGESIKRAADFKAAEKARVLEIQHNANSDMEGRPARSYRKETAVDKVLNSSPVQLLFAPLGTFDQMLRMFGSKNVKGEGYLWNRYMRGWLTATENEYTGYRDATAELDAKAAEVLGKGKTWADLFALERKLPKATVRVWDDGEMRGLELPQGNLLYIYMVNKMADGRMKLRKMGVTEDDVAAIEDFIDPRLKEIGDWLQEVYLVEKRGKYNEVYERMFGAAMASIDNYFPLKILKDARAENVDVGVEKRESEMASTITGSFIKRKRNALPLDLLNSDAFSVVLDHLQEMEHISAYAEWNRDLNTLLSYKHFRNQVKNMRSAYGSGERLWKTFNKVACIAAGTYDPPKALADKLAVNIAKGVTAAKISLRVFTALKQLTSFPAYLSDSNPVYLLKGVANPYGSWKWCMENLPLFEKRWKSRMASDPRLLKNEMDWSLWRDNVVQMAARWGMTPNAFVDALTVCIGARAMYETRRRKYIRYGYGLEEAERRAKQDASILYNQTQQSSEGAFLSALQVDRSWYSVMFTVFRNSSMSYTRQLYAALRNTGRRIAGGAKFKGISEAFMAKQMERDGIDPDKASKNAKAEYRKSWINDFVRAGVFGYVLQLAWNCGPYALYMLFGDDEKKGKEMWHDIWTHTAFGSVEGLTGGDAWSAGLQSLWNHYVNGEDFNVNSVYKNMPLTSDLLNVVKKVGSDNYGAVNDVLNLLVQAGFGVNPQTLTDAAVAIYDYCGSDVETTKECALLVMRVMNCPQSQMDNIYFDEIDATGEEAKAMSVEEIAERYARYKALRSAPLRALSSDALKAAEKKPRERVLTEAKEQLDGRLMTEEAQRYLDEYEATKKKVTETRALADTDPKAFMQQMPALARSGEFRRYRRVGLYKSEVNKLTKKLLRTSDPAERRALFGKMLDARDKMLKQVREME
jgi:site-specific DNA-cytosine methylase